MSFDLRNNSMPVWHLNFNIREELSNSRVWFLENSTLNQEGFPAWMARIGLLAWGSKRWEAASFSQFVDRWSTWQVAWVGIPHFTILHKASLNNKQAGQYKWQIRSVSMERYSTFTQYKLPKAIIIRVRCSIVCPTLSSGCDDSDPCKCGVANHFEKGLNLNPKPLNSTIRAQMWLRTPYRAR